jgi:hypothetical protein
VANSRKSGKGADNALGRLSGRLDDIREGLRGLREASDMFASLCGGFTTGGEAGADF